MPLYVRGNFDQRLASAVSSGSSKFGRKNFTAAMGDFKKLLLNFAKADVAARTQAAADPRP